MNFIRLLCFCFCTFLFMACWSVQPKTPFDAAQVPLQPNYSLLDSWAAHPDKDDPADRTPNAKEAPNLQKDASVDVIFLHPTTYTGSLRHQRDWNADVADEKTNRKTDKGSIQYQASIFNGVGRVFAPRYRQAHLHVFYTKKDTLDAQKAVELAYQDTKAAFLYYLEHWNNGRPFILAGHSQGGLLAMRLIRELLEGSPWESQMVTAYIVGWPVQEGYFQATKPCETPEQTQCFCTWRTWERKYGRKHAHEPNVVCTNPLIWRTTENEYAPKSLNEGGVVVPFEKIYPEITDAEVCNGILLARKPKFRGSLFFRQKNYHAGDLNLYYMNVRQNAQVRSKAFLQR